MGVVAHTCNPSSGEDEIDTWNLLVSQSRQLVRLRSQRETPSQTTEWSATGKMNLGGKGSARYSSRRPWVQILAPTGQLSVAAWVCDLRAGYRDKEISRIHCPGQSSQNMGFRPARDPEIIYTLKLRKIPKFSTCAHTCEYGYTNHLFTVSNREAKGVPSPSLNQLSIKSYKNLPNFIRFMSLSLFSLKLLALRDMM